MKILLLGGTGAMGTHLGKILTFSSENQIYITTRKQLCDDTGNIHFITGNAHDLNFLQTLLKNTFWDVIVDFMVYSLPELQSRIEDILNHCGQYVFLSSSRVYAENRGRITEDHPRLLDTVKDEEYLKTDEYALAKAREENVILQQKRKNWTIIRPYITFSEIRLQLGVLEKENWLYRALHGRTIVFSRDIADKKTTLTYGYDVACGIASILGKKEAFGEIFHITQSKSYTWNEILNAYLDTMENVTGKRPPVKMVEHSPRLKGSGRYQVLYDRLFNREFDSSKIGRFIDVSSFSDPIQKLKDCLAVFIREPRFLEISWGEEAANDRITHEFPAINEFSSLKKTCKYFLRRFFPRFSELIKTLICKRSK